MVKVRKPYINGQLLPGKLRQDILRPPTLTRFLRQESATQFSGAKMSVTALKSLIRLNLSTLCRLLTNGFPSKIVLQSLIACACVVLAKIKERSDSSWCTSMSSSTSHCLHCCSLRFPLQVTCISQRCSHHQQPVISAVSDKSHIPVSKRSSIALLSESLNSASSAL